MAFPYSPSLPATPPDRRPRLSLRAVALDLSVGAVAVVVFLAPGRLHHAATGPLTDFGGAVSAPVAPARAPTAQRETHRRYVVQRIPCAAGEGHLTCWTTAPAA